MTDIAPSLLAADFTNLGRDVAAAEAAGARYLHLDIMDGHFVPNISYGPDVVKALRPLTTMIFDVHLMITDPDRYVDAFVAAGADLITVHAETCPHLHRSLQNIREKGIRAGVALNPSTPLSVLDWVLPETDLVLIMSVNPGFGGQKFIPSALDKIRALRQMVDSRGLSALIQVDGGINLDTAAAVAAAGADVLVAGSAVFGQTDPGAAIRDILAKASVD